MLKHQGVWLPDGEEHFIEWMTKNGEIVDGKGTYQIKKIRAALSYCGELRTAIDIGGHCGLWAMHLTKKFACVRAFEPVARHRECFRANVPNTLSPDVEHALTTGNGHDVFLYDCALGEKDGLINIYSPPTSSGGSYVSGDGDIPLRVLDSFNFEDVDFIKVDCEGYELFALRGARKTIERCWPVIIVEQKPGHAQKFGLPETAAVPYLQEMGYRLAQVLSGDFIMVPT